MEISVFSIQKSHNESFKSEIDEYIKMSKKYAKINDFILFSQKIAKAQSQGQKEAHLAYDEVYEPKMSGFCVVLDEGGKELDSLEFAEVFSKSSQVNFFIGGAYGFSQNLKERANLILSLSKFTMAHKIAKLVLFEQIFRALCIRAGHPYHK